MIKLRGPMVSLDIETTSNIAHETRIVELHIMKIHPKGEKEEKTWLFNPEQPITKGATDAHGITNEDVADKPKFKDCAIQVYNMLFDVPHVVTYNGDNFDIPILYRHLNECGINWVLDNVDLIDVFKLVRIMNPRTLSAMYLKYVGEELEDAHSAGADTFATAKLLHYMMLAHPEIPSEPKEIELFQNEGKPRLDIAGKFTYNDENKICFKGGKHDGEVVDLSKHESYLSWMKRADKPPFNPDTIQIVDHFLNNKTSN